MTPKEAYEALCEYNLWRKGEGEYMWGKLLHYSTKEINIALDVAIETLKKEVEK